MKTATRSLPRHLTGADRCMVLGIGNPLMGDDGVGIHVLHHLLARPAAFAFADDRVELLEGGTLGYLLTDRLAGVDALIVVDAADIGGKAGDIRVFEDEDMDGFLDASRTTSAHEVGLIDLVQMMALTDRLPRRRALVGIQTSIIAWDMNLSPALGQSVARASSALIDVVASWYGAN